MLNPYVLLASLVLAIGLFGSGVSIGHKWAGRAHAAAVVAAQVEAIERVNQDAATEKQRALAAAKTEADARAKASARRHKGELDAVLKANPVCDRDSDSVRLLNDAIATANGDNPRSASELPDAVRADSAPSFWQRFGNPKLGVPSGGELRPVPETAR